MFIASCCNYNLAKDKSSFLEIHQKVYQDDVELIFRVFLFHYGRFPITISELVDSAQNDQSTIEWLSLKMSDPFSHNNEPFKYLSFDDGKKFLLVSRGPDRKFNHYDSQSSQASLLNSPTLLVDSKCSEKTNYCGKDIMVLCGESKSMLITNSKIMDNTSLYFDQMISENKRYTNAYKSVLLYIEPIIQREIMGNAKGTDYNIDVLYGGYTFRFLLATDLNNIDAILNKIDKNFSIFGVYDSYNNDTKLYLYKHCIFEESFQPLEITNLYNEKRQGSAFNMNRCKFSVDTLVQRKMKEMF
jgi:hypothetical protein